MKKSGKYFNVERLFVLGEYISYDGMSFKRNATKAENYSSAASRLGYIEARKRLREIRKQNNLKYRMKEYRIKERLLYSC